MQVGYNWSTDVQDDRIDDAGNTIRPAHPEDCAKFNWIYTKPNDLTQPQGRCDSRYSEHVTPYGAFAYTQGSQFINLYKNWDNGKIYFHTLAGCDKHNRYLYLDGVRVGADKDYLIGDK